MNVGDLRPARGAVDTLIRPCARHAVRALGVATSAARALPDFLIIGTKRGGTTSLYRYLSQHPSVVPLFPSARVLPLRQDKKGVHYFDSNAWRPLAWYRSFFPLRSTMAAVKRRTGLPSVTGEASPYYLCLRLPRRTRASSTARNPYERSSAKLR